jgi:hypothetical protein
MAQPGNEGLSESPLIGSDVALQWASLFSWAGIFVIATVLHRRVISGYPVQGERLSGVEIDKARLVGGYSC